MRLLLGELVRFVRANRFYLKTVSGVDSPYGWDVVKRHASEGRIKLVDALYLAALLREKRPATVLEIGSFLGFSAYWILETSLPWNAKVTAVDPNIRHRVFDSPRSVVERLNNSFDKRITIESAFLGVYGEGVYYDYDHYEPKKGHDEVDNLLSQIPSFKEIEKRFDFIFIDGDHSYRATMENFRICVKSLNPGGTIVFHDAITWPDVGHVLFDLKKEFGSSANIRILGRSVPRLCDGLGVFQLNG